MRNVVMALSAVGLIAVALTAVSLGGGKTVVWSAKLTATQEFPKQVVKNPAGNGTFTGTFVTQTKVKYKLTFGKLTGAATAAHIHLGAIGKAGNVVVPICAPCKSPVRGTITVTPALVKDFTHGLLYVNVHTAKNPNGEIRGQLAG